MKQLDQLKKLAHGMALQFGKHCEIVIHDVSLVNTDSTIVHIENGYVSSRKLGDGPSHPVLEALASGLKTPPEDRYGYLTRTKDGRLFKSTTMFIREEGAENIGYIFCINLDVTGVMAVGATLKEFIYGSVDENQEETPVVEEITTNVTELLDDLLRQCEKRAGKAALLMNKDERIEAVRFLNDAGAFLISKSMDTVASYFGISKFTIYNYMNAVNDMNAVNNMNETNKLEMQRN